MEHHYSIIFVFLITYCNLFSSVSTQIASDNGRFNADKDAQDLRKSIVGIGTDERKIVEIVTQRSIKEIAEIRKSYFNQFQKDLVKDMKNDISGTFRKIVVALLDDPNEYLAKEIHNALNGAISVDYKCISQILCTRVKPEIEPIMESYKYLYSKDILTAMEEKTSGDYKIFIKKLLTAPIRTHGPVKREKINDHVFSIPDPAKCNCDVNSNPKLMDLMAKDSYDHIRVVVHEYEVLKNLTVEVVLETCCTKPLMGAYKTVVQFAKNSALYYANQLNKAMAGFGTDEAALTRLIVSRRHQNDFGDIKRNYMAAFKTPLKDSVAGETSGNYRKILISLIGDDK